MASRSRRHSVFACDSVQPSWTQIVPVLLGASQNFTCAQPEVAGLIARALGLDDSTAVISSGDVDSVSAVSAVGVSSFAPAAGGSLAGSSAQAVTVMKSKNAGIHERMTFLSS